MLGHVRSAFHATTTTPRRPGSNGVAHPGTPHVTVRSRMFTVFSKLMASDDVPVCFSSIVTLKGGLSHWLPSSGGPCHIY